MFKGYRYPYDADTAFAYPATDTPRKISIWAPIERAKQLAIYDLKLLLLMYWNVGEETYLDPDEARQAVEKDGFRRQTSRSCRGLRVQ